MRVVSLATVFPSPERPLHGLFVWQRLRHCAETEALDVVAPVSWFRRGAAQPGADPTTSPGLTVHRPTFFYVPGIMKILDGVCLALSVWPTMRALHRQRRIDLIDAHFGFPDGVAGLLLGWWFRCPVVVTFRGNELDYERYRLRRWAIGVVARRAAAVIAVSHELADHAIAKGAPRSRVHVIANGVETTLFRPMPREEAVRQVSAPLGRPLVVSVGHLTRRKGMHHVIEAFASILGQWPAARLVLVGGRVAETGDYDAELRALADRLGLHDRVSFAGSASQTTIAAWLNAADVFVLSSAREGCPNVVWEAMACGCPVVASAVGEVPWMVDDSVGTVVGVPVTATGLAEGLRTELATVRNRAAIRAAVELRTWRTVAARVRDTWRDVGGRPGQSPVQTTAGA